MIQLLYSTALLLLVLGVVRLVQTSAQSKRSGSRLQRTRSPLQQPSNSKTEATLNPKAWFDQAKAAAEDRTIARNRDHIVADLERQFNNSPSHNPDA